MLQQDKSDDFVLASGEMHSVREFVEKSFAIAGITIRWEGYEVNEVGVDAQTGKVIVRVDRMSTHRLFSGIDIWLSENLLPQPNTSARLK